MDLTERQNWLLSAAVGILLAANALAWTPRADGFWDWAMVVALTVGGLLAMANGVRAIREPGTNAEFEWTTKKTRLNVAAVVILAIALVVQLLTYRVA
jgi:hypothetical protein